MDGRGDVAEVVICMVKRLDFPGDSAVFFASNVCRRFDGLMNASFSQHLHMYFIRLCYFIKQYPSLPANVQHLIGWIVSCPSTIRALFQSRSQLLFAL